MLSCVSSNYTVAALHTSQLSSSPSGPIPMASGGPKIWMKFCLRKEHRRLQGIIYGKRCGIPKTLAQRRENGGRITSLLLRCSLSAKGDSSLQLFELVSPTRKVIHHAIHAVVSGDVVARRQDRIVDTAGEDHAADECRYACMSGSPAQA